MSKRKPKLPPSKHYDLFNFTVMLALTQHEVDAAMSHLGHDEKNDITEQDAFCWSFYSPKTKAFVSIIAMDMEPVLKMDQVAAIAEVAGSLAHEATHATQAILGHIGESDEAVELPAYLCGNIVEWAMPHAMAYLSANRLVDTPGTADERS